MDRYSPLAPAFVRVLLLPVGQIERRRFLDLLDRLKQDASIVRLGDIEDRVGDQELLLSPKTFPQGCLLYNYTTSVPSEHHHQLSPYELFREPLLVIGVVDGLGEGAASGLEELSEASRHLRERHQRVVHRQLLVIDKDGENSSAESADNAVHLSESAFTDSAAVKDAAYEISARFLSELSTYTRALQASPSIQTPGQTARSLQRSSSTREHEKAPPSGRSTPTGASEAGSPVDSSGVKTPPYGRSSPATSFDQIASNAQNALSRSDSRAANRARNGGRASSQDRVSVQGFGSMSKEKLKNRGQARVGIVTGFLYMMAGQWPDALKILVENTHKARSISDFLWHAKGMEGIVVCLLLHIWTGIEFQIPTICYPISDRVTSGHSQRFSINMPSDFRTAEAAQKATLHKFSNYLPDLIKQVLNLYDSGEASLELPFLVISEATIRSCKLFLLLQRTTELSQDTLSQLLDSPNAVTGTSPKSSASTNGSQKVSNSVLANMLAEAQPMADDNVPVADQVAILAGTASIYHSLDMKRKRATSMREMVVKLTQALSSARKRGAAEMGIHPAATLSADNSADALLAAMELSGGLHQMLEDVAVSYGVPSLDTSKDAMSAMLADASGNEALKQAVLSELSAFCEASPDLQGLLRVNTALLRGSAAQRTAGGESCEANNLSREEQIRLTSTINRSVGVSKHFGLPKLEATYWDPFLVRDVKFLPPDRDHKVVSRASLKPGSSSSAQSSSNPLLYDPNASRPGTAVDVKPLPVTLVQGEEVECIVKLQNPYDVSIEVESLSLVADGAELSTSHQPISLGPLRLQEVPVSLTATSTGEFKITACRVKVASCAEQDFPIFRKPWAAPTPLLIKNIGQEAGVLAIDKATPPAQETMTANVIEAQPLLRLQNTSLVDEGLMLLDGEVVDIDINLRNDSDVVASLVDFVVTNDALSMQEDACSITIPAGGNRKLTLRLRGRAGLSHVEASFLYGRSQEQNSDSGNVRVLRMPLDVTVNASLQLQHLDVVPVDTSQGMPDVFTISLDIGNAWPKSLNYRCWIDSETGATEKEESRAEGTLAPGQIERIFLALPRLHLAYDSTHDTIRTTLLQKLTGTWTGGDRKGRIDFSKLQLSAEALDTLRSAPVEVRLEVANDSNPQSSSPTVRAGSFLTIHARITNHHPSATPLVINLTPRAHDAIASTNDSDSGMEERRFAVAGAQHRILPPMAVGKEAEVEFALCPLLVGELVVDAVVRPARMLRRGRGEDGAEGWIVKRSLGVRVV